MVGLTVQKKRVGGNNLRPFDKKSKRGKRRRKREKKNKCKRGGIGKIKGNER